MILRVTLKITKEEIENNPEKSSWHLNPEDKQIWDDNAFLIYQIFQSYHHTWIELNWKNVEENISFVHQLFIKVRFS